MEALEENVNIQKMEKLVEAQETLIVEEKDELAPSQNVESPAHQTPMETL